MTIDLVRSLWQKTQYGSHFMHISSCWFYHQYKSLYIGMKMILPLNRRLYALLCKHLLHFPMDLD